MNTETALQTLRQPRLENPSRVVTAFCVEVQADGAVFGQLASCFV